MAILLVDTIIAMIMKKARRYMSVLKKEANKRLLVMLFGDTNRNPFFDLCAGGPLGCPRCFYSNE